MSGAVLKETKEWAEFVGFAERLEVGTAFQEAYAFRGQPRASWETLQPSLLRHVHELRPDAAFEVERLLLRRFQAQAFTVLPRGAAVGRPPGTTLEWWYQMQHYGVPTRLLDWTHSMYVAAYFAVESEPDHDGAVWVVHKRSVENAMATKYASLDDPRTPWSVDGTPDVLQFVVPSRETDRMTAQQTLFTVSPGILADHGAIIDRVCDQRQGDPQPILFCKIVIPRQAKRTFLRRLHRMNITASSLFPGIDGLGRSLSELTKIATWDASRGGAIEEKTPEPKETVDPRGPKGK
jgi:hypothetical protein